MATNKSNIMDGIVVLKSDDHAIKIDELDFYKCQYGEAMDAICQLTEENNTLVSRLQKSRRDCNELRKKYERLVLDNKILSENNTKLYEQIFDMQIDKYCEPDYTLDILSGDLR